MRFSCGLRFEAAFPGHASSLRHRPADNLAQSAQGFRRGANRVRKKMVRPQATAFVVPELTPLSPRSGGKLCKTVRPSYPYLTKVLHGRPCRKDMKMRVLIAVAIAVLVIVIVGKAHAPDEVELL